MFESLWKKTASFLEQQVPINSISLVSNALGITPERLCNLFLKNQVKAEHASEVCRLKDELKTATNNYETQSKINKVLQANTKMFMQKLESYQIEIKLLTETLRKSEAEREELEQCLEESNQLNKEQMLKSAETLQKLQESIKVADEAMTEISILTNEKQQMEAECNHLAQTIGSVIENASEKVEKDVEKLKRGHEKETEHCNIEIEKLKQMILLEAAKKDSALESVERLGEKLKTMEKTNSHLREDLKMANQAIVSYDFICLIQNKLDMKFSQLSTEKKIALMKKTIKQNDSCQAEIDKLKKIIEHSRQNKEKIKNVLLDITKKFEERISRLVVENEKLKTSKGL